MALPEVERGRGKEHTLKVRCVLWPGHWRGRNAAVFIGGFSEVESHWVLGMGGRKIDVVQSTNFPCHFAVVDNI